MFDLHILHLLFTWLAAELGGQTLRRFRAGQLIIHTPGEMP